MKSSKAQIHAKFHKIPVIRFQDQKLTSFSGLLIFQTLFIKLGLKTRLKKCFTHLRISPIFGRHLVVLLLIDHLLLGFRWLREIDFYRDDPLVLHLLGLRKLPDVSTISRTLSQMRWEEVNKVRDVSRSLVVEGLKREQLPRLTFDFDGSVITSKAHAEGTAVGFNKRSKGERSYYPLFCTVAQTSQFFDVHHRPGNVHDSNGAAEFRFTASVPFERFPMLKDMVQRRKCWRRIDTEWSYFETKWKPKSWDTTYRFIFIRKKAKKQYKGPLQLHLFEPREFSYDYKVIVTNKTESAKSVVVFHNGRGSQEATLGEAKNGTGLDVIATRRLAGNQVFTLCAMMAHNLSREIQMLASPASPRALPKRPAAWAFQTLDTLRHRIIQRAGRLTHGSKESSRSP